MDEYTWIWMEDEWRTKGRMSIHEYEWKMNEELKDDWVDMNMNGRWIKNNWRMNEYTWIWMEDEWRRIKGWMSIHEYEWKMNEEEVKEGWVYMNMNGRWMKKN